MILRQFSSSFGHFFSNYWVIFGRCLVNYLPIFSRFWSISGRFLVDFWSIFRWFYVSFRRVLISFWWIAGQFLVSCQSIIGRFFVNFFPIIDWFLVDFRLDFDHNFIQFFWLLLANFWSMFLPIRVVVAAAIYKQFQSNLRWVFGGFPPNFDRLPVKKIQI